MWLKEQVQMAYMGLGMNTTPVSLQLTLQKQERVEFLAIGLLATSTQCGTVIH